MIKYIAKQRLRMLHGDTGGQSIIFVALVLLVLVSFMALVINVGHRAGQKVEIQLGTDAAALSGGTWIARGLNVTAMLNVSMTEVLAWIIFLKAFKRTYDMARIALPINNAAATALIAGLFTTIPGLIWRALLIPARILLSLLKPVANKVNPTITKLWNFMRKLRLAEDRVTDIMGGVANVAAWSVADKNITDLIFPAILLPVVSELPTEEGDFKDICDRTHDGSHQGYENFFGGTAPINMNFSGMTVKRWFALLWAPASGIIPTPSLMYLLFVKLASNSLCSGEGSSSGDIENLTTSVNTCGTENGKSEWVGGVVEVDGLNSDTEIDPATEPGNIFTLIMEDEDGNRLIDIDTGLEIPDKTINGRDFGDVNLTGSLVPALNGEGTLMSPSPALYPNSWCRCDYDIPNTTTPNNAPLVRTTAVNESSTSGLISVDNPGSIVKYYKATRTYYTYDSTDPAVPDDPQPDPAPDTPATHVEYYWSVHYEDRYYKEEWGMTKCVYTSTVTSTPDKTKNKPKPLVLSGSWEDDTNYLVLVYKSVKNHFTLGSATGGGNDMGNLAMAQVKVYNASGEDNLFNQDWHARLAPVNLNQAKTGFTTASGDVTITFGKAPNQITYTIPVGARIKEFLSNNVGEMVLH